MADDTTTVEDTETEETTDDTATSEDTTTPTDEGREPDWKAESRKHERRMKQERKAREEVERKLKEREDADKSEQEKAIETARAEAKAEALSEAETQRRADRLEVAVTRLAAKGVKVGDNTVKFTDPEDALVFLERRISRGLLEADDIFDTDGKVQTDAVTAALGEILEEKPGLAADHVDRPSGSSDAGKGDGGGSLDDLDVEGHLAAIKRHK